jgi:hypothetical protein
MSQSSEPGADEMSVVEWERRVDAFFLLNPHIGVVVAEEGEVGGFVQFHTGEFGGDFAAVVEGHFKNPGHLPWRTREGSRQLPRRIPYSRRESKRPRKRGDVGEDFK